MIYIKARDKRENQSLSTENWLFTFWMPGGFSNQEKFFRQDQKT